MVSGDSPVRRRGSMRKVAPWSSPTWRSFWGVSAAGEEEVEELWRRGGVVVMTARGRTERMPRVAAAGRRRARRGGIVGGRGVVLVTVVRGSACDVW